MLVVASFTGFRLANTEILVFGHQVRAPHFHLIPFLITVRTVELCFGAVKARAVVVEAFRLRCAF